METASKRTATRCAWFLGATACALVLTAGTAGTAGAQELTADLVGSSTACRNAAGPIQAEGAAVCSAELRLRLPDEIRLGAETARNLPGDNIGGNPRPAAGCVRAPAEPGDPPAWNCTRPSTDRLYAQCVVEIGVAVGDGGRVLNEAACLLRTAVTFAVLNQARQVVLTRNAGRTVECLVDQGAARPYRADATQGEPVNVCTIGIGVRQRDGAARRSPLRNAQEGWRVKVTQDNPPQGVVSPYTGILGENLF